MTTSETRLVRALVGWPEVRRAVDRAGGRVVDLLRRLPPEAGALPVPGLAWTVAETAAHLLTVARRGTDRRRASTLAELAELNQRCLEEIEQRAVDVLADLLEAELRRGSAGRQQLSGRELFPLHFGVLAEVPVAACYLLADLLVHGHDLARATGEPCGLPSAEAALALHGVLPSMRAWVVPEVLDGPQQRTVVDLPPRRALVLEVGDGDFRVRTADDEQGRTLDPGRALLVLAGRRPGEAAVDGFATWFAPV